jgi:phosphatidylglycerol:prolipoprotein diacylglycerol transferase
LVSFEIMLATYIHNMDPVIFDVVGPIKLRWYGLGYLLAFVLGYYLLRWQARKKLWVMPEAKVADFIAYAAFFGVFIGGRLGYILFYQIPENDFQGWQDLLSDPLMVLRVWDGGMSSHGGILGLMIFTWVYARRNKVSWTAVGDGLCVVAPIGIGLVRLANFINGELYGRVAGGVSWAMKFPASLYEDLNYDNASINEAYYACRQVAPELGAGELSYGAIVTAARDNSELSKTLGQYLQARHPSQLYEAILEGLVLFAVLFFARVRFPKLANGIITGLFFLLYAVFRIIVESYREPDSAMIGALTKGQFYSTFMIVAGLGFIGFALWRQSKEKAL